MKPLDVGRLNKRITFLELKDGVDEMGLDTKKKAPFCSVWATVKPMRGAEQDEAGRVRPQKHHTVTIRYRKGITPDMLIQYAGRILEIESVIDVEEAHYMLELRCVEKEGAEKYGHVVEDIGLGGAES